MMGRNDPARNRGTGEVAAGTAAAGGKGGPESTGRTGTVP